MSSVTTSDVLSHNASLKSSLKSPTAVFVGATQGIGLAAMKAFTKHTESPTIYFVGRSESTLDTITAQLKSLNASGTFLPIKCTDLTLLKNVDDACDSILKHSTSPPRSIDVLCNTAGFVSFSGRSETKEGLDAVMSIQYYSRMKFAVNLLPLLQASSSPRVLSVLAGGKEGQLWADDLELKQHYSVLNVAGATATMTTLFMEAMASKPSNEKISWIHVLPGFVGDTNIFNSTEHFNAITRFVLRWLVTPVVQLFVGITSEECGERVLYSLTSPNFARGSTGSGVYLVQEKNQVVEGPKLLQRLREQGLEEKLYDHTMAEFGKIEKF